MSKLPANQRTADHMPDVGDPDWEVLMVQHFMVAPTKTLMQAAPDDLATTVDTIQRIVTAWEDHLQHL